jgi:hypothetical protein
MIPELFSYLLKLSLSLAIVYLFYRLVLQDLTFYHWNRWYLLSLTLLSFFIPLLDVSAFLDRQPATPLPGLSQYIPQVDMLTPAMLTRPLGASPTAGRWDLLLGIILLGMGALLVKSGIQFFSFVRIRQAARLISDRGIKIYQVDADILPFSFGRSIFLNQALHRQQDLQEIIRHEYVHVKQGHTADVIWMELVCILNWYNPFAWLLRRHLRQNLEYIADNQVLLNGTDKKQYQYLLLQVTGAPAFHLAHQFNFSSLKKRIKMMNKMPTARPHLAKFLFLLPLLAVLILAFRGVAPVAGSKGNTPPLVNSSHNASVQTDPSKLSDAKNIISTESVDQHTFLVRFKDGTAGKFDLATPAGKQAYTAAQRFHVDGYSPEHTKRKWTEEFRNFLKRNPQIIHMRWRYDQEALSKGDWVFVADKLLIGLKSGEEEVFTIQNKGDLAEIEKKYGKLPQLPPPPPMVAPSPPPAASPPPPKSNPPADKNPQVPPAPAPPQRASAARANDFKVGEYHVNSPNGLPEDYKAFLKRNPTVGKVLWFWEQELPLKVVQLKVLLKSGVQETYNWTSKTEVARAEKKYGKLPWPAPPVAKYDVPPPVPARPEKPQPPE